MQKKDKIQIFSPLYTCLLFLFLHLTSGVSAQYEPYFDLKKNLYGFKDEKGKIVIKPVYQMAYYFDGTKGIVFHQDAYHLLNKDKKIVASFRDLVLEKEQFFIANCVIFKENGLHGLASLDGKILVEAQYDQITALQGIANYFQFKKNNNYFIFSCNENKIVAQNIENITIDKHQIWLKKDQTWACMTAQGISPFYYKNIKTKEVYAQIKLFDAVKKQHAEMVFFADSIISIYQTYALLYRNDKKWLINTTSDLFFALGNNQPVHVNEQGVAILKNETIHCLFALHTQSFSAIFDQIIVDACGNFFASKLNQANHIFDPYGKLISTQDVWEVLSPCSEGLYIAKNTKNDVFTYLDAQLYPKNHWRKFSKIRDFKYGMATVEYEGFWGVIDKEGKFVISPVLDSAQVIANNLVSFFDNGLYGIIDTTGFERFLSNIPAIACEDGGFLLSQNNKFGYVNAQGFLVLPCIFDKINLRGKQRIMEVWGGDWHFFMDKKSIKLPDTLAYQDYTKIFEFDGEFARAIKANGGKCIIDYRGKMRHVDRFDSLGDFADGFVPFMIEKRWGFLDQTDNICIQPHFDSVGKFVDQFCVVMEKAAQGARPSLQKANDHIDKLGLIDKKGKEVLKIIYTNIKSHYQNNDYFVITLANQEGLFNKKTKEITLYPQYDQVGAIHAEYVVVRRNQQWGIVKQGMGESVLLTDYEYIVPHFQNFFWTYTTVVMP